MAGNPNQKLKLLYIADYLKHRTGERSPASTDDIMAFLKEKGINSERKSIYNDIDVLKEYGLDIKHTRSGTRGYYLEGGSIEPEEFEVMINAIQTSPILPRGKSVALIKKLRSIAGIYCPDRAALFEDPRDTIAGRFGERMVMEKSENEELYDCIESISRAVAGEKKLSFIYRRRRLVGNLPVFDDGREFIISPYAAIWNSNRFYLVGNKENYDNLSHYRIDRMKAARVLDEPARPFSEVSDYKTRFDAADYSARLFNMYSGGEETAVQLTCKDSLLETMIEQFGTGTQYRQLPNGKFTLRAKVSINDGFIFWILGFGGDVIVDEPQSLCDEIKDRLKDMMSKYS